MPADRDIDARRLEASCRDLIGRYDVADWWPARSRFEVLVGAVLVQNTRWPNVSAAIRELRRTGYLAARRLRVIDAALLQELIRPAGCQRVKARRLIHLATWIDAAGGLNALEGLSTPELRSGLLGVHGIGNETADAILGFGFQRRVFIADRYARTWLMRMGLVPDAEPRNYESCRGTVESALIGSTLCLNDLHAAIVLHGQAHCGRRPRCPGCPLTASCGQSGFGLLSRA